MDVTVLEATMPVAIRCSCGCLLERDDEEGLYSAVRSHVDPLHPEMHRLQPAGGMDEGAARRTPYRDISHVSRLL